MSTTPDDAVAAHPIASRLARAFAAHPILKEQKKLLVSVDGGRAKVSGTVYTQDMLRQVVEICARVAGEDVLVAVEADVRPVQPRPLVGKVPTVSPGAGSAKRNYSVDHLG